MASHLASLWNRGFWATRRWPINIDVKDTLIVATKNTVHAFLFHFIPILWQWIQCTLTLALNSKGSSALI